jgi:dihydrofolate reductase
MGKVVLYIAASLDGFIAREDGNLDWLNNIPNPDGNDYGYGKLINSISTVIMGKNTYKEVIGFGIDWPYPDMNTYIVTHDKNLQVSSPNTFLLDDDIHAFVNNLKSDSEKDIWLVGGGEVIKCFLEHHLIDQMIICYIPVILGKGIPLFLANPVESTWELSNVQPFSTGIVSLTYNIK